MQEYADTKSLKLVCIGDGGIGKTMMLISFAFGKVADDSYVPTVFDNYSAHVKYGNETVLLNLWDTAGQEDYDRIRPLSYPETDVFILAYSVVNPDSYHNVRVKWFRELKHHCPNSPFILVGTKTDLRDNVEFLQILKSRDLMPLTYNQGVELAQELQAEDYRECSAATRGGIHDVFIRAIKAYFDHEEKQKNSKPQHRKSKQCMVL
ncbi:hypothetical protein C9374_009010 [Naegleria lovaniensis]|uniref:Rho family small GTPase n=1 Tax=Naegleria lovaniensis TaxID=51637 RepID=A0AA88GIX8_NAELO|nr:uncharacterized protein C9374_009010 [Naegleria lovaniensis]KAG2377925.1 hypothetical protein C9374_009010 [Naegleria lovaniensis]